MAADISRKFSGDLSPQSDLRIVLLGKVGAGKSVVAGHILGQGNWKDKDMCVKTEGEVAGRTVTVVETPGWDKMSVKCTSSRIKKEIVNSVTLSPPGPHALLLVVPLGEKISDDEKKSVQDHMELLSERVWKHTMLVFVSETDEEDKVTPFEQVKESTRDLLEKCGGRYHVLCGPTSNRMQVTELLQKIEGMVKVDDFFLPKGYYELFERTRTTYEDREKKLKQSYELQLTQTKANTELRKRRNSMDVSSEFSTEEQKTKDDHGCQKVDQETVKDGYKEVGMPVPIYNFNIISLIFLAIIVGFFGAIAGAQYGPLGSCVGIVFGIAAGVLVSFGIRAAVSKTTDISPKSQIPGMR
ncbi:GTPase IMAP family member 7-like [Osmerus mordax]|uniref:GTPase IMAP family member 7-like n=1 Tax=Osmerus mordax TaxID=8014 RepID=UPI00350ECFAF